MYLLLLYDLLLDLDADPDVASQGLLGEAAVAVRAGPALAGVALV